MDSFREPGHVCWLDIKSRDRAATRRFFSNLFGWELKDEPVDDRRYTKISLGHDALGGLTDLSSPVYPPDMPPHISLYVAVADADRSAASALALGGTLLLPPFDVPGMGRMATLQDPTGGVLSVWEARPFRGMTIDSRREGAPGWFALMSAALEQAGTFYTQLFGWTLELQPGTPSASGIFTYRGLPVAGVMLMNPDSTVEPSQWEVFFTVREGDTVLASAQASGASITTNAAAIPGVGWATRLRSPDGLTCGIISFH